MDVTILKNTINSTTGNKYWNITTHVKTCVYIYIHIYIYIYIYRRPPPCRGVIPVQHTNVCWFSPVFFIGTDSVLNKHIRNSASISNKFRSFLSILGIWGVPPGTPGHPKGRLSGFLIDFWRFWGRLWELLGGLWRSLSALQSTK